MEARLRRVHSIALPLLLAFACGSGAPSGDVLRIDRARFGIADVATPPADSDLQQSVTLPDHWNRRRPGSAGIGWYRMSVDLPADADEPWGLYLPSSSSSFEVFVDGAHLGSTPQGVEGNLQNWNLPEYFALPASAMRAGPTTIDVRLWARAGNQRGLGPLEVGPARLLWPRFRSARFWQVEIARLWLVLGVTLGLFAAGMWAATGRKPVYGCFVWLAAAWTVPMAVQSLTRFPGSFWLGQWLIHVGLNQMAIAGVFLAHRVLELSRVRLERSLLVGGAAIALALALVAGLRPTRFDLLAIAVHLLSLAACGYLAWIFVRERSKLATAESLLLVAGSLSLLVIVSRELVIQLNWLPGNSLRLVPHALPIILSMFFVILTARFLKLYRRAERQNVELEARIREKLQELEERYEQLDQLQRAGVLADERARMTREMHDGMGAQLVSLLALVESEGVNRKRLATGLRESIDELRLIIHSLEPSGSEVGTLLALLRERFAPRIDHSGLRFQWRVGTSGDDFELRPDRALHVVRIIEEAITNVLKHADAGAVEIATRPETRGGAPGFCILVSDDGVGFRREPEATSVAGRGLRNMEQRAHALGGSLCISSGERGTILDLWLPHDAADSG